MTTSYAVARTIEATPEQVWTLLTDAAGYPAWNPTVLSLDGSIAAGEKIRLVSTLDPKRTFILRVSEFAAPRRMVWTSRMPLGLFRGTRIFTLDPDGVGTAFGMAETFTGPLAPLITKAIPDMTELFQQFADGLKAAAEKRA